MMMIHRQQHHQQQQHPTVDIPPWDPPYDDPTAGTVFSPQTNAYFSALHRFLPSCETELGANAVSQMDGYSDTDSCDGDAGFGLGMDSFGCDNFRMYEFKVRRCGRGRSHDWTECPFAHPGEKARRRDPRKFHYSGTACPDFRRGCCRKGDLCEFAHGVFECWLHPARYRTQPCKDGSHCQRRVCFFAHSPDQLRVLPESPPGRPGGDSVWRFGVSPTSVMERSDLDSPPVSPSYGDSLSQLVSSVRGMQIGGGWPGLGSGSPRSPGRFMGGGGGGYATGNRTPTQVQTQTQTRSGLGLFDPWETGFDEEVPMERVESGKGVRAQMYAKLSEENSLDRDRANTASPGPDFGWVSELVK